MDNDIPPLRRPEDMPPIRSQADLHQLWRALVGELGFSSPQLWLVILDADDLCTPVIQHIVEVPDLPASRMLNGLLGMCRSVVEEVVTGGSVAFLRARPGPAGITASDRAWAAGLLTAARELGVACRPVHLANDHEIRAFTPDDAVASA
jgi:hypothetical protein